MRSVQQAMVNTIILFPLALLVALAAMELGRWRLAPVQDLTDEQVASWYEGALRGP